MMWDKLIRLDIMKRIKSAFLLQRCKDVTLNADAVIICNVSTKYLQEPRMKLSILLNYLNKTVLSRPMM